MSNLYQALFLNQQQREEYCRKKRYEKAPDWKPGLMRFRRANFNNCCRLLKLSRILEKEKLVILNESRKKYDKPVIFAPTHIGGNDITSVFEAMKPHAWLLFGDPKEMYANAIGAVADINGIIAFDIFHKPDRAFAKEKMKRLLNAGGNLLCFPEGAWNVIPNQLVSPLYASTVELAITCDAYIVPVALCRDNDTMTYYVSFGEPIDYSDKEVSEKFTLTDDLRNTLASMKWEIMEQIPHIKHSDIDEAYIEKFFSVIITPDVVSSTLQDAIDQSFHPKNITSQDEAFEHLDNLNPNINNAFLINCRNHH